MALVIGNDNYEHPDLMRLAGARRDAHLVGEALARAGFSTSVQLDCTRAQMLDQLQTFNRRLVDIGPDGVGFLYYAGHGFSGDGRNYLAPVDAGGAENAAFESISLDGVLEAIEANNTGSVIVILDAFGAAPTPFRANIAIGSSALPGQPPLDSGEYARALVRHLFTPGMIIEEALQRVALDVMRETGNRQRPFFQTSLTRRVEFIPADGRFLPVQGFIAPTTPLALDDEFYSPPRAKRFGLVIANAEYASRALGTLPGTQGDATVIQNALSGAGFDEANVVVRRNLDKAAMGTALSEFYGRLADAGADALGLLYFSGHGMADALPGRNYLIPCDAEISRVTDLPNAALRLDDQLEALQLAAPRTSICVFDACRSTAQGIARGPRGLAPVPPRVGFLVGFSTSPGDVADDEGLYGRVLAEELVRRGEDIDNVFLRVQRRVYQTSGQMPDLQPRLPERVVLLPN